MDNITEKIAKVTDLTTYADLTPEHLKKLFDDIGGSPEKLRTILNLWFVPDFKPTFVEPQNYAFSGLQDVDFLDTPDTEQAQRPLRLIDLETGNLVDVWNTSPLDSYCMLSHRWKGDEITLAHIKRARAKHLERTRGGHLTDRDDDIHLVLDQAKLDIIEQEETIKILLGDNPQGKTVHDLLQMKINASDANGQFNWARQNRDAKKSKVDRCRMEKDMFDHLINRVHQDEDKIEEVSSSPVVEEAEDEYATAQQTLNNSTEKQKKASEEAEFLHGEGRLGDAVDEMMSRLQRWKSAIKLDRSITSAKNIFQTSIFPKSGARYIWSDTCCIDKLNYGELSQSLSLMGDWYANAEFCLVHLDSDWRAADAVRDWKQFKGEEYVSEPGIPSFDAISGFKPEWANRAWTLQELVMSKMAYFYNSEWKALSRPVESLGYTYPLIPFIELYTRGDIANAYPQASETLSKIGSSEALGSLLEKNEVVIASDDGDQEAAENVKTAVRLISVLHALGFRFPTEMTMETAMSEMTRSVYLTAWNLVKEKNNSSGPILQEVKSHMPATQDLTEEAGAQNVINFLLVCLVAVTKDLIVSDRKSIANFGQVNQLHSWKQGTVRSGFSAERVLQLSCRRKATVAVDHVYSLMGILGVRFQSFHAEGYPKALARLLDEVIISHNDVSVFNWAGVEMGSPVRGRSMYPASHKAYGNEEDRGRRYNMMISAEVQKKRKEIMVTYQGVITMLRDAIECIKVKGRKGLPLEWMREIAAFIKECSFDGLLPELENIGKILLYIQDHCVQPTPVSFVVEKKSPIDASAPSAEEKVEEKSSRGFKPSLPSMKLSSNLKTPKLPSFKAPSLSKPSFGRTVSEPVVTQEPVSSDPPKSSTPEVPEWMSLDGQVKGYLKSVSSPDQGTTKCNLPDRIKNLKFKTLEPESTTSQSNSDSDSSLSDLICPNPIIINSSGIEGIFDIQRIIVTMIDREKLSRQVARAPSPKQKISGWCTLSTGFASVVVNFACEQHMLKKQLDVEQAVEDKIIREDRASKLQSGLELHGAAGSKKDGSPTKNNQPNNEDKTDDNEATGSKPTKEEQTIVRIIDFIQEPELQLVAGEWVLARFSGAPGAKWFLCYLELGSTHSFYGHRIATTDIDFANSSVEAGLVNAWQTYMGRKKRKMCNILNTYIKSFESASKGQERLSKSSEIAGQNYARLMDARNQSLERVMSIGSSTSTLKLPTHEKIKVSENADSDDDEKSGGVFDNLLDQGKEAAMALGEYTVLAAYEKICEMHAKHLDKHLATSVLKKTPKSLQTAVESVDENKGFLPAMFHSSRRVHMF
ncbi:putative vegetative incompatibility protein HET-E-1 [Fusarium austroafricanum]|uniref:Putative vegetative incompatibility protein HET-E-1 n=1 Tax=Fusarium austroafricanum TaxID=2364996 RepID=A0A8H4KI29_9HYPO|nr:putative vegetative incompatibility protein HET-E-1 [Fusarium austroafricanum]